MEPIFSKEEFINMTSRNGKIGKRIFDFIFSILGLIIVSPMFLIIAILIKIDSNGDVFFKQLRVGQFSKPFYIYKFRTMVNDAERLGKQITVGNDSRITKVGAFLRKYKLDELPQLINVFKGEMSFVGPRPEVPRYVKMYDKEQRQVLLVKPGITDLASLEYKEENEILGNVENPEKYYIECIMPHKLNLNMQYINKANLISDIKIILKTIIKCII
ncbi:Sugar transferase involved in LPS biosynthesis (colanic, teichoic acid) [Clostridium cavendishii DSM 21758]|uniref:Sugar transferase involved in LPS biosynthesis (Colanic, teichoic acid) n=2 Tax=Clostridium TaxID=1485 RepID=A0A1M6Q6K0_9CLOT|nr:Sugar transferase involved in LPS biosynthesis (colanic, teichoic acid) [Clostridium cavendishii DSM 21758]